MQVKRNQTVVVNYRGKPRLALVRSLLRKSNRVNVMIALYKQSSIYTDWEIEPSQIVSIAEGVTQNEFFSLSKCFPCPEATDELSLKLFALQRAADKKYPQYAALRKNYGPYESGEEIIARLRREEAAA